MPNNYNNINEEQNAFNNFNTFNKLKNSTVKADNYYFEDGKNNEKEFENKVNYEFQKKACNTDNNFYRSYSINNNMGKFNNLNETNNNNKENKNIKEKGTNSQFFNEMKKNGYEYNRIFNNNSQNKNQTNLEALLNKENKSLKKEFDKINNNNNNNFINNSSTATEYKNQIINNLNNLDNKPNTAYNVRGTVNHKESDIFCLKNNYTSLNKIGEKYLTKKNEAGKEFTSTSLSNSEWCPKNNVISLMNYGSTDYNILNSKIKKTLEGKNCINSLANIDQSKMAYKQKAISEICDLNKIAMPNFQKNYSEALRSNGKVFNRTVNLCNSFYNLFGEYKGASEMPFKKK